MHKTWKKYQGCLSAACFSVLLSTQKESIYSQPSTAGSDFGNVELFHCYPKWQHCVTECVETHLSMRSLMHTTIQCISTNVKSCVFTRSVWPLIFIQLNSTLPNHSLLLHCRNVALAMSSLIDCSLPYLLAHIILLFAFYQVQAKPVLR